MSERNVRAAMLGAGGHVVNQHLPNLKGIDGVDVVAICDLDEDKARSAAAEFGISSYYTDGLEMVRQESLDAIWSILPACARPAIEVAAAEKGIALFCDKPQTLEMKPALEIDAALQRSGALSTVCFRERYRPLWQEAKRLLADKEIVHIRFQSVQKLPAAPPPEGWERMLEYHDNHIGWGPHAIDYCRFVSGLDIVKAQGFHCQPGSYHVPLSTSCNYTLSNGATMTTSFLQTTSVPPPQEPYFLFYYEGGYVAVHQGYHGVEMNGERVYEAEDFQPWLELDRLFVEAVRSGDGSALLNDFHDGLQTLAALLAGWESARRGGELIDVAAFARGEA